MGVIVDDFIHARKLLVIKDTPLGVGACTGVF